MVVDLVVASQFSLSRIRALVLVNKSADDDVYSDSDSNSDLYSVCFASSWFNQFETHIRLQSNQATKTFSAVICKTPTMPQMHLSGWIMGGWDFI